MLISVLDRFGPTETLKDGEKKRLPSWFILVWLCVHFTRRLWANSIAQPSVSPTSLKHQPEVVWSARQLVLQSFNTTMARNKGTNAVSRVMPFQKVHVCTWKGTYWHLKHTFYNIQNVYILVSEKWTNPVAIHKKPT